MKRVLVLLLLIGLPALSQTADQIIKGNLFDPDRGKVEATEDVNGPVVDEIPQEMPILDGIVVIGKYQRAIFRYKEDKTRKLVSGTFMKGDSFDNARILDIQNDEVTIAFAGKRYKLKVDSKDQLKHVPKSRGAHAIANAGSSHEGPKVIERKISVPAVRTNRGKTATIKGATRRTPFGSAKANSAGAKRKPHSRAKDTPF